MKAKENRDLIVGLDIGTSKVTCVVAELGAQDVLQVIGLATQPMNGLKRGVVVNIEATVDAVSRTVQDIELSAGYKIRDVYVGLTGSHIRSFNSKGMVAIKDKKETTRLDVEHVIEVAGAMPVPAEQQILHILTQEFIIDGQGGVREPIGMSGAKLEVNVHIVTGAISAAQNLIKCVRRCGLEASELILQPLAASTAILTEDEKELGVCMVDIGGGTSDIVVYTNGAIRHTAVIPVAGDQITNDIAMVLRTPTAEAEVLKTTKGVALQRLTDPHEMIEVASVGNRTPRSLARERLAAVIEPRVLELFEMVQSELRRSGYEELLSSGIVLTGGSAVMPGMKELVEEVFHLPVRIGTPAYDGRLAESVCQPHYSAAMGLLKEGLLQRQRQREMQERPALQRFFTSIRNWIEQIF